MVLFSLRMPSQLNSSLRAVTRASVRRYIPCYTLGLSGELNALEAGRMSKEQAPSQQTRASQKDASHKSLAFHLESHQEPSLQ